MKRPSQEYCSNKYCAKLLKGHFKIIETEKTSFNLCLKCFTSAMRKTDNKIEEYLK